MGREREREWAREGESWERVGRESESGTRERVSRGERERDEKGAIERMRVWREREEERVSERERVRVGQKKLRVEIGRE